MNVGSGCGVVLAAGVRAVCRSLIHPVKAEFKDNAVRLRVLHGHQSAVRVRDPADNAACDVAITMQVLALPELQAAERIFAYCSVVPEVDTHAILAQARRCGKMVALPVPEAGGQMYFARYDGALVPGRYGIPQPPRSAPVLQPQPGDLMLVPALAYDRAGRRLGRGGGYYDRCLAQLDCCTVGLIRAAFLLDALPTAWNDMPVAAVVTEQGILRPQEKPGLPEEPRSLSGC